MNVVAFGTRLTLEVVVAKLLERAPNDCISVPAACRTSSMVRIALGAPICSCADIVLWVVGVVFLISGQGQYGGMVRGMKVTKRAMLCAVFIMAMYHVNVIANLAGVWARP